jgi:hypothetical protein
LGFAIWPPHCALAIPQWRVAGPAREADSSPADHPASGRKRGRSGGPLVRAAAERCCCPRELRARPQDFGARNVAAHGWSYLAPPRLPERGQPRSGGTSHGRECVRALHGSETRSLCTSIGDAARAISARSWLVRTRSAPKGRPRRSRRQPLEGRACCAFRSADLGRRTARVARPMCRSSSMASSACSRWSHDSAEVRRSIPACTDNPLGFGSTHATVAEPHSHCTEAAAR